MEPFTIEETVVVQDLSHDDVMGEHELGAKIKVVGVGGAGGNMVNHMISSGASKDINFFAINTDVKDLRSSLAENKVQIGIKLTKGLGAGMRPEKGKASAEENLDDIKESLQGADIVFVACGLGGGTGTGAAPIVAQAAKEVGALTIAVVSTPFKFEGKKRSRLAHEGLLELKKESDSIVVIPNQKILSIVERNLGQAEAYKMADEILHRAVSGTSNIILSDSNGGITVDFADFQTVMSYKGTALMGISEFHGQNAASEALKSAIESPLLDNVSIEGAMGILVHFTHHSEYPIMEVSDAMDTIEDRVNEEADVIHGATYDDTLPMDMVKITVIATGFEKEENQTAKKSANTNIKKTAIDPNQLRETMNLKRAMGSDLSEDVLDIPTWMRRGRD
jgi:cell division protein FtsZ